MNTDRRSSRAIAFFLFFFSGATGLVYEVVWLRELVLVLGSTLFATSAILSTFMGGLALGSFLAGRVADRSRRSALALYGILEIGIGIYALLTPFLFDALVPAFRLAWHAGGEHSFLAFSLVKFVGVAVVLLPPTVLMGASLPVLARQIADDPRRIGGGVGLLYALNTFGAIAGTFVAGFLAIRFLGAQATTWVTAALNLVVGGAAILAARPAAVRPTEARPTREEALVAPLDRPVWPALWIFGASGFAAMVLEVAWTRGLSLVLGSSVYAFSLMLLAFLTGLAAGSAVFAAWLRRRPGLDAGALLAALLLAAGLLAWATSFAIPAMPRLFAAVFFRGGLGPDGWFAVQFAFGLIVMFPATFALGGIFPAVLQLHARGLDHVAESVGAVYASNTVGTIVGAAAGGFAVLPLLGVRDTLVSVAALEVLLGGVALAALTRGGRVASLRSLVALLAAVGVSGLFFLARPAWDPVLMNSGVYMNLWELPAGAGWNDFLDAAVRGNRIVYAKEGLTASVVVEEQPRADNLFLAVNGKVEASTQGDMETQLMCGHLPVLLHEAPRDVLVVGLASGITVGAVASHPDVRSIRVIEVEAAMVEAARFFSSANGRVLDDPRVTISINDARNDLTFASRLYDVIVSEPSNPWMTVASNLFTEDFFRLARTRLRQGGVMSQWIQTYGLRPDDLRSVIAAFRSAFPEVLVFETFEGVDVLLMGSDRSLRFDLENLDRRISELRVRMDLARVGVRSATDILPLFRLGPSETDRLVAGAERNTDDNARVEFAAPRALYEDTTDLNLAMIARFEADPVSYVAPRPAGISETEIRVRLVKAWMARGRKDRAAAVARRISGGGQTEDTTKPLQ